MKETHIKRLAYMASPLLTIAVVAGAASAATPGADSIFPASRSAPDQRMELTQEQKDVLEQARQLKETGDKEGARALIESAGIPMPRMVRGEHPRREAMKAQHEAVEAALDAGDYTAFVEATKDAPFADQVDEAFFAKFQEAHAHFEAGRTIMESLGIERPGRPFQK